MRRGRRWTTPVDSSSSGIVHIHELQRTGRGAHGDDAQQSPRRHGLLTPLQSARRLSVPAPRSLPGHTSYGEVNNRWQLTLRDGRRMLSETRRRPTRPPRSRLASKDPPVPLPDDTAEAVSNGVSGDASVAGAHAEEVDDAATTAAVSASAAFATEVKLEPPLPPPRTAAPSPRSLQHHGARVRAAATLDRLLAPLWRLHAHRRRTRAVTVLRHYAVLAAERRLARRRGEATDLISALLQQWAAVTFPEAVRLLRGRVVCIQRAVRHHCARVSSAVELNYRKIRRDIEPAYWAAVVEKREKELEATCSWQPLTLYQSIVSVAAGASKGDDTADVESRKRISVAVARRTAELDVYNYYLAGPLPERLLRDETRRAVTAALRREAARVCALEKVGVPENLLSASPHPRQSRALVTIFLPEETYKNIMDNVCFLTSQLRDDATMRAHLRDRRRSIAAY